MRNDPSVWSEGENDFKRLLKRSSLWAILAMPSLGACTDDTAIVSGETESETTAASETGDGQTSAPLPDLEPGDSQEGEETGEEESLEWTVPIGNEPYDPNKNAAALTLGVNGEVIVVGSDNGVAFIDFFEAQNGERFSQILVEEMDGINAVAVDQEGKVYLAGYSRDAALEQFAALAKLGAEGELEWIKRTQVPGDSAKGIKIEGNNVFCLVQRQEAILNLEIGQLMQFDLEGNQVQEEQIAHLNQEESIEFRAIDVLEGQIVVSGAITKTLTSGFVWESDLGVWRNRNGTLEEFYRYPEDEEIVFTQAYEVEMGDGVVYAAGQLADVVGNRGPLVLAIEENGEVRWESSLMGGEGVGVFHGLDQDEKGDLVVGGSVGQTEGAYLGGVRAADGLPSFVIDDTEVNYLVDDLVTETLKKRVYFTAGPTYDHQVGARNLPQTP